MKEHLSVIKAELPVKCFIREVATPPEVILLLHGYSQAAEKFSETILPIIPPKALVIAANGPFIVPQKIEKDYRIGYSWYFYDYCP